VCLTEEISLWHTHQEGCFLGGITAFPHRLSPCFVSSEVFSIFWLTWHFAYFKFASLMSCWWLRTACENASFAFIIIVFLGVDPYVFVGDMRRRRPWLSAAHISLLEPRRRGCSLNPHCFISIFLCLSVAPLPGNQ